MPVCWFCGEDVPVVNKCPKCESEFCELHTEPNNHDCPGAPVPNPFKIPAEPTPPAPEPGTEGVQCWFCGIVTPQPVECESCHQKFCPQHTIPANHDCMGPSVPNPLETPPAPEIESPVGVDQEPYGESPNVTKEILREWLQKFGVPNDKILEPSPAVMNRVTPEQRRYMENALVVPYTLVLTPPVGQALTLVFEVKLIITQKWINIKLLLMRHEEVPPNLRATLHESLLVANFLLNEVTYSISHQGDILVETDMPINTDYTNFQSEYGSVVFGAGYFLKEILPKIASLQARDTYQPKLYT